jgi:predicted transcriptional regulator
LGCGKIVPPTVKEEAAEEMHNRMVASVLRTIQRIADMGIILSFEVSLRTAQVQHFCDYEVLRQS